MIDGKYVGVVNSSLSKETCEKFMRYTDKLIKDNENDIYLNCPRQLINIVEDMELSDIVYNSISDKIELSGVIKENKVFLSRYGSYGENNIHLDDKYDDSKYVVIVYLNDDFQGGKTEFYNSNFEKCMEITPEQGKAVVFDIDLMHRGTQVIGNKYILTINLKYT